jgi:hypothetical protein
MTASVIISIIVPVLYVGAALALIPALVRERYRVIREEYTTYSDDSVKNKAVWSAFGFSLIWPACVFVLIGRYVLDKEARQLEKDKAEERALALAERRLALQQAQVKFQSDHENAQWLKTFNELDKQSKDS